MQVSQPSLVMGVVVRGVWAAVGCHCWVAECHRDRLRGCRDAEWARLVAALRDGDTELGRLWTAESARIGRRR